MPHQFLLHLHRSSGLVQPRTIRVAERVPTDPSQLPSLDLACVVDENPLAVRCGLTLPAPHARCRSARRTRDHTAPGGAEMPLLDLGRVVRSVRHRVGEHPPFLGGYGLLAPSQNDLGQRWVQRNIVLGVFGLDVIYSPAHEAALNQELMLLKIEVVPLKRRDLAHAKTEALGYLDHRAIRLTQCRNDEFEFAHSERGWTLPALAATFHANQGNG